MNRIDGFEASMVVAALTEFEPVIFDGDNRPSFAQIRLFGTLDGVYIAVLRGLLASDSMGHEDLRPAAERLGTIILRSKNGGGDNYYDRAPYHTMDQTGDFQQVWLSGHGDRLPQGILKADADGVRFYKDAAPSQRTDYEPAVLSPRIERVGLALARLDLPAISS